MHFICFAKNSGRICFCMPLQFKLLTVRTCCPGPMLHYTAHLGRHWPTLRTFSAGSKLTSQTVRQCQVMQAFMPILTGLLLTYSNGTSKVTIITEVRSASAHLFAGTWRPLVSVITTLYYVAIVFSSPSCTFSVLYTYSKFGHHPHPLGYLCAKFCSFHGIYFVTSIAELASG